MRAAELPDWDLKVFYDGECPICRREMDWLRKRTPERAVVYQDITASDFDPAIYGTTGEKLMAEIHAQLPDGSLITGVEVFRQLYSQAGLGWILAPTRLPILSSIADFAYRCFAKNRLRLTGRCKNDQCATG